MCWLSPTCAVARVRARGGRDRTANSTRGPWLIVCEVRDGRVASMCEFDLEDEDAAFAYAEERVRATTSRLAVTNEACEAAVRVLQGAYRPTTSTARSRAFPNQFVYDDHRRFSGDAVVGREAMRAAIERVFDQYTHFEFRVLAVRGQRLTSSLVSLVRRRRKRDEQSQRERVRRRRPRLLPRPFDEDDFEGAYRELERRYYAGEGAAFAEAGALQTEWVLAVNDGDLDKVFGQLTSPDLRVEDLRRAFFPERSAVEFRAGLEELSSMVESSRTWNSVLHWLSPTHCVARNEREAIGHNGERYAWTRISAAEVRDGQVVFVRQYELDDEDAAFAFAEEQMQGTTSWLAVRNRASETWAAGWQAMRSHDAGALLAIYSDQFHYDDRRRLGGGPVVGREAMLAAIERILDQYTEFEYRVLAVRGDRLLLGRSHWTDGAGNEATYLHVAEIDEDALTVYDGRFDEDDFETAYREFDCRYYAGEGAAFAEGGAIGIEWVTAVNRGDLDRAFGELTAPEFRIENRSGSAFSDRSIAELRSTTEELNAMVSSSRIWNSVVRWLSPTWAVQRIDREAVGHDGETYTWTYIDVSEIRGGRIAAACRFDIDDEEAAFAYAEERVNATTSQLAVSNRATQTSRAFIAAMNANDLDGAARCFSDRWVFDDRRRLGGNPLEEVRVALARILEQYSNFEIRTLAVRGERTQLVLEPVVG